MEESEINNKLKPIAEKVLIFKKIYEQTIKELEEQASIILGLNKEEIPESKIKIALKQNNIEIRLEKTGEVHYYYPLMDGYTSPYDSTKKREPRKYFFHPNAERVNWSELEKRGHVFKTNSDVEILVHLYEEEKEKFISKLNGMFGFIIWDEREKRLLFAKDRFGQKPVYFTR